MAGFIVLYDDENGVAYPYTWDQQCKGAICGGDYSDGVAHFRTRGDAQKAIKISKVFSQLCKARGESENEDFTTYRKHVRIVELKGEEE